MEELKIRDEKNETSMFSLEPISFSELSEVLGGKVDHKGLGDSGHAGGLVCWC
jgi:hypothetical protein